MSLTVVDRPTIFNQPVPIVRQDRTVWYLAIAATITSIAAFVYFYAKGTTLAYIDSISHMEIARHVISGPSTGFGQLGGVWLPLPHILMLPFVWNNTLYYSGFAGSLTSMVSYVVCSVFLYRIVFDLTGKQLPALVGALIFMTNPNILYMQSTPMTELLLFACMAGMVYYVQRWIRTDEYRYIKRAGLAALLGTLSRYEAWVLLGVLTLIILGVAIRKGYSRSTAIATTLAFLSRGGLGIVGWLIWNQLIFGNMMYFQNGPYAKPSLWLTGNDPAIGNWLVAIKTYWYAMADDLKVFVIVILVIGLMAMLVKRRLASETLPALSLVVFIPFFVMALETGQRPLHVMQINGDLYNTRFGLLIILPASIMGGYLFWVLPTVVKHTKVVLASVAGTGLVCLAIVAMLNLSSIMSYMDPHSAPSQPGSYMPDEFSVSAFLRSHYTSGLILMQSFGNEILPFDGHVSLSNVIYEGSNKAKLWQSVLTNPLKYRVVWIVMRVVAGNPDLVYKHLHSSSELSSYRLVYQDVAYKIYERKQ